MLVLKNADAENYATLAFRLVSANRSKTFYYTPEQRRLMFAALVETDRARRAHRRALTNPGSSIPACARNLPEDYQEFNITFKSLVDRLWSKAGMLGKGLGFLSGVYPQLKPCVWFLGLSGFAYEYLPESVKEKILTVVDLALTGLLLEDSLTDPLSGCLGGLAEIPSFPKIPDISPDALITMLERDEQLLLVVKEAYAHADSKTCVSAICNSVKSLQAVVSECKMFKVKQYAILDAAHVVFSGIANSAVLPDRDLHGQITQANRLHLRIHLLYRLLHVIGVPLPALTHVTALPNPVEWSRACQIYAEVLDREPDLIRDQQVRSHVVQLWQVGRELMDVVHAMSDRSVILEHLLPIYMVRGQALTAKIKEVIAKLKPAHPPVSKTGQADLRPNEAFRERVLTDPRSVLKDSCEAELLAFEQIATALLACLHLNILRQTGNDITSQALEWERAVFNREAIYSLIGNRKALDAAARGEGGISVTVVSIIDDYVATRIGQGLGATQRHLRYHTLSLPVSQSLSDIVVSLMMLNPYARTLPVCMWPVLPAQNPLIYEKVINSKVNSVIRRCQFSPDSRYLLLSACVDGEPGWSDAQGFTEIYQTSNWEFASFICSSNSAPACSIAPNDSRVLIGRSAVDCCSSGHFEEYTFQGLEKIGGGGNPFGSPVWFANFAAHSPSGRYVALAYSVSWCGTLHRSEIAVLQNFPTSPDPYVKMAAVSGACIPGIPIPDYHVIDCCFSKNEKWFAACGSFLNYDHHRTPSRRPALTIWDAEDWEKVPVEKLETTEGSYHGCAFSPNHQWLVLIGLALKVWNTSDWTELYTEALQYACCMFSLDSEYLLAGCNAKPDMPEQETAVHIRSTSTWQILRIIPQPSVILHMDISPDNQKIAICGSSEEQKGRLSVWDVGFFLKPAEHASSSAVTHGGGLCCLL